MAKSIVLAMLHQGLVRNRNEDNLYLLDTLVPPARIANFEQAAACSDSLQIYAVADGMGGSGIGDVAAQTVLKVIEQQQRRLRPGGRFDFSAFARDTVDLANRSVCEMLAPYEGMPVGTTLSLLAIDRDTAYTFSLGNSRVYLYRDQQLYRLTEDHVSHLPDRRRLTRYLGFMADNSILEVENMTRTVLSRGDVLLLTTDGITDYLSDEEISSGLAAPLAFIHQIRQLRDLALRQGGRDNLALIGIKIQEPQVVADQSSRGGRQARQDTADVAVNRTVSALKYDEAGGKINQSGQSYAGPAIKGNTGSFQNTRQYRWLRPLLFFLVFILLGILLGKLLFSLPAWLKILFPS